MFFVSDCGKYIAIQYEESRVDFDVMKIDGSKIWLNGRYKPKSSNDSDIRYKFPEFKYMITGYHLVKKNESGSVWIFKLDFADMDQTKKIAPWTGNCILKEYSATFSRHIKFRKPKVICAR